MIDLHIHTKNSDGSDTIKELLIKCENSNLEYISITDHDTCKSYNELEKIDIGNFFTGKIIPGCEFTTIYKGRTIEILGYNINTDFINEWCSKFYTAEKENQRKVYCTNEAIKNLEKLGIHIDKDSLDTDCAYSVAIYKILLLNKDENEKILGKGFLDNRSIIFRNGFANPESPLFIDVSHFFPTPKEITGLIHEAGGKSFLAHPYQYSFNNTLEMISNLRKECEIDGLEAFHSSFTLNQMNILKDYAKRNRLYISGGSDYHGTIKPEIKLKTGCNNLNICKDILVWLDKE